MICLLVSQEIENLIFFFNWEPFLKWAFDICSNQDASVDNEGVGGYTEVSGLFLVPGNFHTIDDSRLTTLVFNFLIQDAC